MSGNASLASSSSSRRIENIYEIPMSQLTLVCYCIDIEWTKLAEEMGYQPMDIEDFREEISKKGCTPVDLIIRHWGNLDHSITELFMVLKNLRQYSAMHFLKDFVEEPFHKLIPALRSSKQRSSVSSSSSSSSSSLDINASPIPQINYDELVAATHNWSDKRILGRGGYGTVFKGSWKNTDVAIKRIQYLRASNNSKLKASIELKQSLNELRYLNGCRHDNILPLYGYSMNGSERCLVYQYMTGGALETRIQQSRTKVRLLPFDERKRILLGTALGLQYLHTFINDKPLIHCDIKPANILLDQSSLPKIGDFGLVREGAVEAIEVSSVCGTRPYLPDDYIRHRMLTTKIDTYSYGVMMFEMLTTLRVHDKNREQPLLAKYMHKLKGDREKLRLVLDKTIDAKDSTVLDALVQLAFVCTAEKADDRPHMRKVFETLESMFA